MKLTLVERIYNVGIKWGIHKPKESYTVEQICAQHDYIGFEWAELLEAWGQGNEKELEDAVGDVLVTIVNTLIMLGEDVTIFEEVLEMIEAEGSGMQVDEAALTFQINYHKNKEAIRKERDVNYAADLYNLAHKASIFSKDWRAALEEVVGVIEGRTGAVVNGVFQKDSSAAQTD